jgi:hypothetical protein
MARTRELPGERRLLLRSEPVKRRRQRVPSLSLGDPGGGCYSEDQSMEEPDEPPVYRPPLWLWVSVVAFWACVIATAVVILWR